MTEKTICGERDKFAIEFSKASSPQYIHVRLWIAGYWVGDINDSLMPEFMCARLLSLACPALYHDFAYTTDAAGPTYEQLLDRGGMSFGESFDPFSIAYYCILDSELVHFKWQLHEAYYSLFPEYPRQAIHRWAKMSNYRLAVKEFVTAMIAEGYYTPRPGVPKLAELEYRETEL